MVALSVSLVAPPLLLGCGDLYVWNTPVSCPLVVGVISHLAHAIDFIFSTVVVPQKDIIFAEPPLANTPTPYFKESLTVSMVVTGRA